MDIEIIIQTNKKTLITLIKHPPNTLTIILKLTLFNQERMNLIFAQLSEPIQDSKFKMKIFFPLCKSGKKGCFGGKGFLVGVFELCYKGKKIV